MIADLPADYYRNNFLTLLNEVNSLYADLLTETESEFYAEFSALSDDAQKLYVRMLMRKGPLFRSDALRYREIASTTAAARELAAANFIAINPQIPLNILLALLKNSELCELGGIDSKLRRPAILQAAVETDIDWPTKIATQFTWYLPLRFEVFQAYLLFFFGNLHQDLTEFVLSDLQHVRFENYRIDPGQRFFRHRQDWQDYFSYYQAQAAWELCERNNPDAILQVYSTLPIQTDAPLLQEKLQRLALRLARQLERLQQWQTAQELYSAIPLAAALERRARIHYQAGEIETALELCVQIAEQSSIDAELQFAQRFYHKLVKEYHLDKTQLPPLKNKRIKAQEITIAVDPANADNCVELLARDYYAELTTTRECHYVENTLFNALFGLAFWDIIFADVAGVFLNPFQQAPKDIYSAYFKQRRSEAIAERFRKLETTGVAAVALQHFDEKFGLANRFVNWSMLSKEFLQRCFAHIPNQHLLAVFEHMLKDLRHYRSGFPDLILFKHDGGYELIEIKAPGDRIQSNQSAWMKQFARIGIPHRLVNVQWQYASDTPCINEAAESLE